MENFTKKLEYIQEYQKFLKDSIDGMKEHQKRFERLLEISENEIRKMSNDLNQSDIIINKQSSFNDTDTLVNGNAEASKRKKRNKTPRVYKKLRSDEVHSQINENNGLNSWPLIPINNNSSIVNNEFNIHENEITSQDSFDDDSQFSYLERLQCLIVVNDTKEFKKQLESHDIDLLLGKTEDGDTILQKAVSEKKFEFVQLLLSALNNWLNHEEFDNFKTESEYLNYYKSNEKEILTRKNGKEENNKQIDYINQKNYLNGNTALFNAVSSENELITRMLLNNMADPKIKNYSGDSAEAIHKQKFKDKKFRKYFSQFI